MSDKKQDIQLVITSGEDQLLIQSDIDFNVEQQQKTSIRVSDVVYKLILEKIQEQKAAVLAPGSYRLCMTLAIASMENSEDEDGV